MTKQMRRVFAGFAAAAAVAAGVVVAGPSPADTQWGSGETEGTAVVNQDTHWGVTPEDGSGAGEDAPASPLQDTHWG